MKHHSNYRWIGSFLGLFIQILASLITPIHASQEDPNSSKEELTPQETKVLELALCPETAGEKRQLTFRNYAVENNYQHFNNIFKDKEEIEEIYKDDVTAAEARDAHERENPSYFPREKSFKEFPKGKSFKKTYKKKEIPFIDVEEPQKPERLRKKSSLQSDQFINSFSDSEEFTSDSDSEKTVSMSYDSDESLEDDLKGFIVPNHFSIDESDDIALDILTKRNTFKNINSTKPPLKRQNATVTSPEKSLKRPRVVIDLDEDYDDAFPEKMYPPVKRAKTVPAKSPPKGPVHTNPEIKSLLGKKIIFYDTETTCITHLCDAQFVEIAAMIVDNGIVRKTIHCYLNPNDKKSWAGAEKAHGLGVSFLRPQTRFYKIAKHLQEFFGDEIRCAHNGFAFDDKLLNYEFTRAWIFYHFQKMLNPKFDQSKTLPSTIVFDWAKIKAGHAKLKEAGILKSPEAGAQQNLDQIATDLASAAMLYFSKEHMSKEVLSDNNAETNTKAGPMMFQNGRVLPNQETHPQNYEAAAMRLTWFGLIKIPTDTFEQRKKLTLPHEKGVRDAITRAETYLRTIIDLFDADILDETEFRKDKIDRSNMFDTLYYARENKDVFVRGSTITNLKLDSLLDYYRISRYDRESGNHGAGIDTSLLFQVVQKMLGETVKKGTHLWKISQLSQKAQENYFFKKNSISEFDNEGRFLRSTLLHDDQIGTAFGDPSKMHASAPVKSSFTKPVSPPKKTHSLLPNPPPLKTHVVNVYRPIAPRNQNTIITPPVILKPNAILPRPTMTLPNCFGNKPQNQMGGGMNPSDAMSIETTTVQETTMVPATSRPLPFNPANGNNGFTLNFGEWSYTSKEGAWSKNQ